MIWMAKHSDNDNEDGETSEKEVKMTDTEGVDSEDGSNNDDDDASGLYEPHFLSQRP